MKVTINGVIYGMAKELIVMVGELSLKGRSLRNKDRVYDETSLRKLFHPIEDPIQIPCEFIREDLPKLVNIMCHIIMCYITLEDRL